MGYDPRCMPVMTSGRAGAWSHSGLMDLLQTVDAVVVLLPS